MNNKLSKSREELLYKYFDAAANLYGIIPLRKLLEIYNNQNEPISEQVFCGFVEKIMGEHHQYDILGEDEMYDDVPELELLDKDLVAEYFFIFEDEENFDDYYMVKEEQIGKPYYIPDKDKFLRYCDSFYFEKTPEFISMRAHLRNYSNLSKEDADELAMVIVTYALIDGENMESSYNEMEDYDLKFKTEKKTIEFTELMFDCVKNSRMHFHRGHTPNEIIKL